MTFFCFCIFLYINYLYFTKFSFSGSKKNVPFFKSEKSFSVTLCTIAFAAISGIFFSCAKEELDYGKLNLIGKPKPITVNATLPKSASLDKTTLSSDGKVCWESDDKITVNGTELGISEILSDTLAVFEGKVGDITTAYGSGYWATYPTSLKTSDYTASSVDVTLPATQTYSGNKIPNYMAAYGTADGSNPSLSFKNMCCIIKIPVQAAAGITDNDAKKLSRIEIEVTNTGSRYLSGCARVSWNGEYPTLNFLSGGSYTVALDCGLTDVSTEKTFSIMIPANTGYQFKMKFFDGRGFSMEKTISSSTDLQRSRIYTTAPVNLDIPGPHVFSVSPTKKVYFSLGNLQWKADGSHDVADGSTAVGTWRFAEHQWDVTGSDNGFVFGSFGPNHTPWIDLFGWGTSGYGDKHPAMVEETATSYGHGDDDIEKTYYDWGYYNAISNGGNKPMIWRTLTYDEWEYLFLSRSGASSKYGAAIVNGVNGLVLLPDDWTTPPSGVTFTSTLRLGRTTFRFNTNVYDVATWQKMEANGAVFLPAAGFRTIHDVASVGLNGNYWSSTHCTSTGAQDLYFGTDFDVVPENNTNRALGQSVRLVHDAN